MVYILYNPYSNNKKGSELIKELEALYSTRKHKVISLFEIKNMLDFCKGLEVMDSIVLCGGDGTLNHFINDIYPNKISQPIFYYPGGSGNDFYRDIMDNDNKDALTGDTEASAASNGAVSATSAASATSGDSAASTTEDSSAATADSTSGEASSSTAAGASAEKEKLIKLNKYIEHLPEVYVEGKKYYFINGVGYGIDGYCCEKGDEFRKKSDKVVNYTGIAVKGLLGGFQPCDAKVTIDGITKEYKSVWLAPTMLGRYYGGGMKVAPNQNRLNEEHKFTTVVWHTKNPIKTLTNFTKIFTGEHLEKESIVEVLTGNLVTVEFEKPQALQIDGETIKQVKKYTVSYD